MATTPLWRLCRVDVIHDQQVDRVTCQRPAHAHGLEAARPSNDLAFIGVAQPCAGDRGHVGRIETRRGENAAVFLRVDDALYLTVKLSRLRSAVRHDGDLRIRILPQHKGGQAAGRSFGVVSGDKGFTHQIDATLYLYAAPPPKVTPALYAYYIPARWLFRGSERDARSPLSLYRMAEGANNQRDAVGRLA